MATLNLNGKDVGLPEDPRTTLLDFLHQHLSLFGTKKGCDHGQCGACTVIADGERINACLVFAFQLEGAEVTTIEGIGNGTGKGEDEALHPLQQAFIERDAFQCGYCTSGQICSGVSLLRELSNEDPSAVTYSRSRNSKASLKEDISERMSGNLCRCGAYPNIVDAITDVIALEKQ
ncbi:(2Fe-2S)-binding protein [Alteromonas sp. S005]|uniref:(2Fe-2S)-binding protein n=1 Tax=Alteromonas sp. S005 TaxID=3117400 RepID=UPI002FE009BC